MAHFRRNRTMCYSNHHHSIFCILPPYILGEIAKSGTAEQRQAAVSALDVDATLRTNRITFNFLGGPLGGQNITGAPPKKQRTIYDSDHTQTLPGKAVRSEGQGSVGDVSVNEAYDGL